STLRASFEPRHLAFCTASQFKSPFRFQQAARFENRAGGYWSIGGLPRKNGRVVSITVRPGRENLDALFGYCHHMFPLGRERTILRDNRPVIRQLPGAGLACIDHGLDRENHALLEPEAFPGLS